MEFILNGIKYEIKEVKDYCQHSGNFAFCDYNKCEILVDKDLREDQKKLFLWHELIHLVLFSLQENELSHNEVLVQSIANQLNQIIELKIIEK